MTIEHLGDVGNPVAAKIADPACVRIVLDAPDSGSDGRSPWMWVQFENGAVALMCFPQGDTYWQIESDLEDLA